jgi:hypothetical protein
MNSITINNINGTPPYSIYVCDENQISCVLSLTGVTAVPPSVNVEIPPSHEYLPIILIKIVDSTNCQFTRTFSCTTPTATPTVTPTNTPSTSITPSNTQTSITPTPSLTQSVTPSFTKTPTKTPNQTPVVPSGAYLIIEPLSGNSSIGSYMSSKGLSFLGFSNGTSPSSNQNDFNLEMNAYLSFSGWSSGEFPYIRELYVYNAYYGPPIYESVIDSFGNKVVSGNFQTIEIPSYTLNSDAWYTVIIYTALTQFNYQQTLTDGVLTDIDISTDNPNTFGQVSTESTIYQNYFSFSGDVYPNLTYRVYTTFPSPELLLNNSSNIYLKGSRVGL